MGFFDFMFQGGTPRIFVTEALAKQQAGLPLIDIREIYEWNKGHAAGAVHIPMAQLVTYLENLEQQGGSIRPNPSVRDLEGRSSVKDQEIMLICASGNRSLTMAQRLIDLGYKAVSVHGGTTAWKAAGYPIEQ